MQNKSPDLSIIIVSYNTRELLLQTLESVYRHAGDLAMEVFVVDNASIDESPEAAASLYPGVKLLRNSDNRGFAHANNQAMGQASGRYILLLNSDTVVQESTFRTMIDFMDANPRIGAAGCKVIKPDGSLDLACRRSFPTPLNSLYHLLKIDKLFPKSPHFARYNLTYLDEDQSYPVDCLVGAFMMVRREVVEQVGVLDEQFFMYGEDIDWCYRIKQAGWEIWYYPEASIIHHKGASSKKLSHRMIYEFYRSMYLYFKKHQAKSNFLLVNWLVYSSIAFCYIIVSFGNILKRRTP